MFWRKIILDGFIPFTHVGNKHVEIEFDQPCTAILGANGCGKSSLLREMNVNPACRTDYLKGGKIEKVIEHQGHEYTLTSDFVNATSPHSFKKDGVELNLSGTSDTQKDLIEEHLGVSSLINDIMAGNVHICSMQKNLRKQLFSAAYPSDLSFVLEYHKKVCTQIRTFANQIKLLQGREGSLLASLIEDSERERMTEWRTTALLVIDRIEKINFLLSNEIDQLSKHPIMEKTFKRVNLEEVKHELGLYRKEYNRSFVGWNQGKEQCETVDHTSLHERYVDLEREKGFLQEKQSTVCDNLQGIRDELDKFSRLKNAPKSDKKAELASELEILQKEMETLKNDPNWQNAPSIQKDNIQNVTNLVSSITDLIGSIHPYVGKLIGQEKLTAIKSECDALTFENSSLLQEKVGLEQQIYQQKSRREMMTQNSYPPDCSRVCGLRATLEASVRDIDLHIKELTSRLEHVCNQIKTNGDAIDKLKMQLQEVSPAIPLMKSLWDKLSENYLVDLVLNGESYLDCLNHHCSEIPNRIIKGIESSTVYFRYKDLFDRCESIKNTIVMMESSEAVNLSIEVIDGIIKDKQEKLDLGIAELDLLENSLRKIKDRSDRTKQLDDVIVKIDDYISRINDTLNYEIVRTRIEFDRMIIREHLGLKNNIGTKLREIEHVLEEQKRVIDVLGTEIRPTMEHLRKQKLEWELVEKGLSPTKGLPCIYLIRFINRLISRANAFIGQIWYCDMELAYLDENEDLDFTISVILNKSTTVKDISLCSNGQKAVIDLAMTFALAKERNFLSWMPLSLDEVDAALTPDHRAKLTQVISDLLDMGEIKQLFLVNHFAVQTGISMCDVVSLSDDGIVLPGTYNQHATIE